MQTMAVKKLVTCWEAESGALKFKLADHVPFTDFRSFVERAGKPQVVRFFREIVHEVEVRRKVLDFHLKVRDYNKKKKNPNSFAVDVYYGSDQVTGPVELLPGTCISCNLSTPLYPGILPVITAGECVLPQLVDQPYVQCHLDAKARPGFIVTPKRHVERLSEMDDEEVYALWDAAVRVLREESIPYRTMILNHGKYRNLPHLHLKVWVSEEEHLKVRQRWAPERQALWTRLQLMTRNRKTA